MEYRILGKTGLRISRMGLGGIPIQKADAVVTRQILEEMLALGVNFIDTARGYTVSEEYLGQALQGIRDQFVLATKSRARSKAEMEKDIAISLQKLQTDYIDLYQIHNPSDAELDMVIAPGGALEALQEAKAAGKIGHIGLTAHTVEMFERALELSWVETIMYPYNIVETQAERLIAACREKRVGFIDMKPLAGGAITDGTLALRFIAANENVDTIIPGMESAAQVRENFAAVAEAGCLTENELARIEVVRKTLGTQFCRRCNYCAPCTVGIAIPRMFQFEGYLTRYGLPDWAEKMYSGMEKTASDCVGCGECEPRCPYNLPIRKMLKKVESIFGR